MNDYPPQQPTAAPKTSGMAVSSLVLGILSFVACSVLTGIPAIICGHISRKKIRHSGGTLTGEGLGLAGLILGYINLGLSILIIPLLLAIAIPNFVKARTTAQTNACISNLRQIDGAKQQWALENKKESTDLPASSDLNTYLPRQPVCPVGGTYTIGIIDEKPRCSVAKHELPE